MHSGHRVQVTSQINCKAGFGTKTLVLYRKRIRERSVGEHGALARFRQSRLNEPPWFGRAIAYRVFNRNRVPCWADEVVGQLTFDMAIALPNSITRSVCPASGFVVCWALLSSLEVKVLWPTGWR